MNAQAARRLLPRTLFFVLDSHWSFFSLPHLPPFCSGSVGFNLPTFILIAAEALQVGIHDFCHHVSAEGEGSGSADDFSSISSSNSNLAEEHEEGRKAAIFAYDALVRVVKLELRENGYGPQAASEVDRARGRRGLSDYAIKAVGKAASSLIFYLTKSSIPDSTKLALMQHVMDPLFSFIVASVAGQQGHSSPVSLLMEHLLRPMCKGTSVLIPLRLLHVQKTRHCFIMAGLNQGPEAAGSSSKGASLENAKNLFEEAIAGLRVACEKALKALLAVAIPPHGLGRLPSGHGHATFGSPTAGDSRASESCGQPGVGMASDGQKAFHMLELMDEAGAFHLIKEVVSCLTTVISWERESALSDSGSFEDASIRIRLDFLRALLDPAFCCIDRLVAACAASSAAAPGKEGGPSLRDGAAGLKFIWRPYFACQWCLRILSSSVSLVNSMMNWAAAAAVAAAAAPSLLPKLRSGDSAVAFPADYAVRHFSLLLQRLFKHLLVCAKGLTETAASLEGPHSSGQQAVERRGELERGLERVEEEARTAAMALARLVLMEKPPLSRGGTRRRHVGACQVVSPTPLDVDAVLQSIRGGQEGVRCVARALGQALSAASKAIDHRGEEGDDC